jgi:hypothetical protein
MSLLDAFENLRVIASEWSRSLGETSDSSKVLAPLELLVKSFDEPQARVSRSCPANYLAEWQSNETTDLSVEAIKHLCWEPTVVPEPRFADALDRLESLYPRQIQGLVHSLHQVWSPAIADGPSYKRAHDAVVGYSGKHKLIQHWRRHASWIVASSAATEFGKGLAKEHMHPDETFAQFRVDPTSLFAQAVIEAALSDCRKNRALSAERVSYALKHLLTWTGWNVSALKVAIGPVILAEVFKESENQRNALLTFLLRDARFGDPRLPANRGKWASMDLSARQRVVEWLSKLSIEFFFEHVLPDRKDPHGRKEFWLRYRLSLKQARPLLNGEDRARLRATIERTAIDEAAIGVIDEQTSAFILGFDNLCVVEFSRKGNACYVYRQQVFSQLIKDIYTQRPLKHLQLKVAERAEGRIVHREGWQFEMANLLARFGIRPQ